MKKYQRLRIGAVSGDKQSSDKPAAKGGLSDRVFGELVPYGDPSWYQGWNSPYYNDSHRKWRAFLRQYVSENFDGNMHRYVIYIYKIYYNTILVC